MRTRQRFGGEWTVQKLNRLGDYLRAYMLIFTRNPRARYFKTVYVDAFAGTGYSTPARRPSDSTLPLGLDLPDVQEFVKGSARVALETEPSFHEYLFIERSKRKYQELLRLKIDYPHLADRIRVENAEANQFLANWCRDTDWSRTRAVVFLDPFGMQVEWELVRALAETRAIDLWLLVPLGIAVNRLLTRRRLPPDEWARRLSLFFGTDEWRDRFYSRTPQQSLFDTEEEQEKNTDFEALADYFVERLKTVFAGVAEKPLVLRNSTNTPLFLLCFAAGNPKGVGPGIRIAGHLLKPDYGN